jgi:stage V sporulation protein SpoVS
MSVTPSITKNGRVEPFGFNPDINGTEETVWDAGGIYAYPSAATVMKVSSSSTNDTAAGTGARTILVQGLDADYNEAEEIVTLNGQTAVNTTVSFLRVTRAYVLTAGSGGTAAGDIYVGVGTVTAGVPATIYAKITLGENQTLMGIWTVPAGYTGYFDHFTVATGTTNANQYVAIRAIQRNFGV